ncbi:MAG: VCBS repeat-containing protein [Candidatus Magasanikbacteria bacterium]|nr:VCBS repeat-containing protein [Candidatus Magasanikbacteria bacterium]
MLNGKFWLRQFKFWTIVLTIVSLSVSFGLGQAVVIKSTFPRLSNYFLSWELSDEQAVELAKWDLVILDMEHQVKNKEKILKMRELNPKIIILAYIASQEIRSDSVQLKQYIPLRAELYQGIQSNWWLKRPDGQKVIWWPGTEMLNIADVAPKVNADVAPKVNGQNWGDYFSNFVTNKVLGSGLWDGIFFDNTWNSLTNMVGDNLDIDNDGAVETKSEIEAAYRRGISLVFGKIRAAGPQYLLMGNDGDIFTELNGLQLENFPYARGWSKMMRDYATYPTLAALPSFSAFNANTANIGGRDDYQKTRYGLTSALLADGFYSFDLGDQNHGQTWWYDEYNFSLGEPAGRAFLVRNNSRDFNQRGLWRRDFKDGLVLVNSGSVSETIDLGGEYEKIRGTQDPSVNDGLIVSTVTIQPQDGLILLRPLDELSGAVFRNGSFARVFNAKGQSLRNGFFAYQKQFKGGQYLYRGDLDNDGEIETLRLRGNVVEIYNGENFWLSFSPFGSKFKGDLSLAVGDVDADGVKDLVVGQHSVGNEIRIFDLQGKQKGQGFYGVYKGYAGGVNLAVAGSQIVAATTRDSLEGKLLKKWTAFIGSVKGGVNIAAGDINGDGIAEIVAGRGSGKPEIKVFSMSGKQIGKSWLGASAKGKTGIGVAVSDVDNDGTGEIVSLSTETFTTVMR